MREPLAHPRLDPVKAQAGLLCIECAGREAGLLVVAEPELGRRVLDVVDALVREISHGDSRYTGLIQLARRGTAEPYS